MTKKLKIYLITMLVLYGTALVTCFICDLVINRALTWFYMVLVSMLISFSITNLPFMVKKYKSTISALAVTLFTYLLLFACCAYVKGDWLISFAWPIATYSFLFAWILFLFFKFKKIHWSFKAAVTLLMSAIFVITCNPLIFILLGEEFRFINLFIYDGGVTNYAANGMAFLCLAAGAVICAIAGLLWMAKTKRK